MDRPEFTHAHFKPPTDAEEKRALFKTSVHNVVVEFSSHCNRKCSYCPVSKVERSTSNKLLPLEMYEKLLNDLATIEYAGGLCLNLYNEPTSDKPLLIDRIRRARTALPAARIYFSTNGDYLDRGYLDDLIKAGLSELYISIHTPAGKPYDDRYAATRFNDLSKRLQKAIHVDSLRPNETMQGHTKIGSLPIYVFATNYYIVGSNRAESVGLAADKWFSRAAPCARPFNDFTISYDGSLYPCCQMFTDFGVHKSKYSVGNLADFIDIFSAYASEAMAGWRRDLLRFGPKQAPCASCSEADHKGTPEEIRERDAIYEKFVGVIPTVDQSKVTPFLRHIAYRAAQLVGVKTDN